MDNIRFLLIFSVVFAHFLEVSDQFNGILLVYKFIYSFHMPVFIFLFGYNVKYSSKRIVYHWLIPYIVFQSIYILFSRCVLDIDEKFQYSTPYWHLWYILACLFYQLLLPLFDTSDKRRQFLAIISVFIISLIIGFNDYVGYFMSLSRFFVFQPWFLLGYYCKKDGILETISVRSKIHSIITFISIAIIVLSAPFLYYTKIPSRLLYGSYSYTNCDSTIWMRTIVFMISLAWILFLFVGVKHVLNKKIPLITIIGQNTWPIFLLHGFFVKIIPVYCPGLLNTPLKVLLLSSIILILLGNKICKKTIYYTCFSWLETLSTNDSKSTTK
ncbi:MAG: acyltransferase family protein [Oscillospiraceae bacterium]|nr:acyltransferase family protein [Oscillospiraceae bacterium]